jgi:hypothetical protein
MGTRSGNALKQLAPIGSTTLLALVAAAGERPRCASSIPPSSEGCDENVDTPVPATCLARPNLAGLSSHHVRARTGLACGIAAARYPDVIGPPYAAILGTLIIYREGGDRRHADARAPGEEFISSSQTRISTSQLESFVSAHPLGACLRSRWRNRIESDSLRVYEQGISPLED